MSSLECSDGISSEDEEALMANMASVSGLPSNYGNTPQGHPQVQGQGEGNICMLESETATVKLMGGVMKHLGEFHSDSSESETEEITPTENNSFLRRKKTNSFPQITKNNMKSSRSFSNDRDIQKLNSSLDNDGNFRTKDRRKTAENGEQNGSVSVDMKRQYSQERFNPFDRDLHMEEDYFDLQNNPKQNNNKPKSGSNASSSWDDISNPMSTDSDDITFADLGLAEDHFSHPEGFFGLSNTEELEMAIDTCKDMILEAPQHSDKQKNLVKKLVQLRLKLQEVKEGPEPVADGTKMVVGHKFQLRTSRSSKHYCEKCNAVIWGMMQNWYRCTECAYSAHEKCLNLITRTCASVKVAENPTYCLLICPDRGLSSQSYRCAECRNAISYKSGFSEPRLCDYSGSYFCDLCHWNDTMIIPARVLHNWDFEPRKVCRASKQFLKLMQNKAVLRIQDVNPMLFSFVHELNDVKRLREELLIMKKYLLVCPDAMKNKFLLHLKSRQHFVESSDRYSMKDLMDVQTDALLPELAQVHTTWAQHIKTDCQICQARGFICELCDEREILFPFDNIATVCSECSYVLHRHCFAKRDGMCPRCERRNKRKP